MIRPKRNSPGRGRTSTLGLRSFSFAVAVVWLVACGNRPLSVGPYQPTATTSNVDSGPGNSSPSPTPTPGQGGSTGPAWYVGGTGSGVSVDANSHAISPGTGAGTWTSRVVDGGGQRNWSGLSAQTSRPFAALPDKGGKDDTTVFTTGAIDMGSAGTQNYYLLHFNGANGNAFAESTNSFTTTPAGTFNMGTGLYGASVPVFDGSTNQVTITMPGGNNSPIISGSNPFSIATWIKTSGCPAGNNNCTSAGQGILDQRDGTSDGWLELGLGATNQPTGCNPGVGNIRFAMFNGGTSCAMTTGLNLADNNWHHVVATRDAGGMLSIYVDGKQATQVQQNMRNLTQQTLVIGNNNGSNRYFAGQLQELAVFNTALNAQQATDLFLRGQMPFSLTARTCPDPTCSTNPSFGAVGSLTANPYLQFQLSVNPLSANLPGNPSYAITKMKLSSPTINGF